MLRAALGALLAIVSLGVAVPDATAAPATAVLELQVWYDRFGTGDRDGQLWGWVVAGIGSLRTGAAIEGYFEANEPAATCPVTGTVSGDLWTSDGFETYFTWSRVGALVVATVGSASGHGSHAITSPVGDPCGEENVTADVLLTIVEEIP